MVPVCCGDRRNYQTKGGDMTKAQTMAYMADATGLTKVQASSFLDAFAKLAYSEAKNGFVLLESESSFWLTARQEWVVTLQRVNRSIYRPRL